MSIVYSSTLDDLARGMIDFQSDAFSVMLVDGSYVPDKRAHLKRSDITGEISGPGYAAGGRNVRVGVAKDLVNDRVDVTLGGTDWPMATITAAGAVYYKARGGRPDADELVAFVDFGDAVASTNGLFSLAQSTLRLSVSEG